MVIDITKRSVDRIRQIYTADTKTPTDAQEFVVDLLTDLMHFTAHYAKHRESVNFSVALGVANNHFKHETKFPMVRETLI